MSPVTSGTHAALFRGMDQAYMMQGDLIAAILVWSGIGWLLDRALGTRPVLLVLGSLIGYAAGMYLIWLRSQRMDADERGAAAADPAAGEGVGRVE
jgi:ATP synthase protein I